MSDNVVPLPRWKDGSTAEEFLAELMHMARADPGDFHRVFIVYHGKPAEGGDGVVRVAHKCGETTMETLSLLGLIEMGRQEVLRLNTVQVEEEGLG